MARTVVFRDVTDSGGSSVRDVTLTDEGALVIGGQDVGPGVGEILGEGLRGYEFSRTVAPDGVAQLRAALGLESDDDLLDALGARFPGDTHAIESFLEEQGIESEFFNWIN